MAFLRCHKCGKQKAKMFVFAPLGPDPAYVRCCRDCDAYLYDRGVQLNRERLV